MPRIDDRFTFKATATDGFFKGPRPPSMRQSPCFDLLDHGKGWVAVICETQTQLRFERPGGWVSKWFLTEDLLRHGRLIERQPGQLNRWLARVGSPLRHPLT